MWVPKYITLLILIIIIFYSMIYLVIFVIDIDSVFVVWLSFV